MFLFLVAGMLTACDKIDEADRYELLPVQEPQRAVLLEEFTAQRCTNCPDAHRTIASLKEQYGKALIPVSIHAGTLGISAPFGLMQPEGNDYAMYWNVTEYPSGVVNRNGGLLKHSDWAKKIREEVANNAVTDIRLSAQLTENEDGTGTIHITADFLPLADVTGKWQLWITESHIKAYQIDNGVIWPNYEHNHVFRACVNGTWGEDIELTSNVYSTVERTTPLQDKWNKENLSVVGFVYNDTGVLQAAECKVELNN